MWFIRAFLDFVIILQRANLSASCTCNRIWLERHSRSKRRKISKTGWWLNAGIYRSWLVHRSSMCVFWDQREIIWFEDVLVTRKEACLPEAISRYLACCSSLVCISEWFANLVDGDDSPWVWTEPFFNLSKIECFQGPQKALSSGWISWLLWGGRQMMSTWFSLAKVMTSRFLVCKYVYVNARLVLR
jgi:hypothetical protein